MVTPEQLRDACERAARYRRQLAIDTGAPAGNLEERIDVVPAYQVTRIYTGGWVHAGYVTDFDLSAILEVRLHPESGRVQVQRPPDVEAAPRPSPARGAPLWYSIWAEQGFAHRGYVYLFEGREYTSEQAARMVTAAQSDEGWSWRPA